jgi:hypothetical protein
MPWTPPITRIRVSGREYSIIAMGCGEKSLHFLEVFTIFEKRPGDFRFRQIVPEVSFSKLQRHSSGNDRSM